MVVAAADRPDAHGDWYNADEWLPATMRAASLEEVCYEAEGRPCTALVRLGYLAEWAGRHDIAYQIGAERCSPNSCRSPISGRVAAVAGG